MADKFFDAMFTASVIGGGSGPAPVIVSKNITANGTYSALDDQADGFNPVVVDVPNSYTAGDEGKVVSGGELVAQTSTTATANGTINTTTNNEVVVNVPNSYTAGDEGKVVSNGTLVAQTNYGTVTENGTYNTTLNNSVTVNVSSASTSACAELYDTNTYETKVQLCLSITNGKAILSGIRSVGSTAANYYIDPNDLKLSDFFNVNEKIITGRGNGESSSVGLYNMQCTLNIVENYVSLKLKTTTTSTPKFYIYLDTQ